MFAVAVALKTIITPALAHVRASGIATQLIALVPHFTLVYVRTRSIVSCVEHLTARAEAHATEWCGPTSMRASKSRTSA